MNLKNNSKWKGNVNSRILENVDNIYGRNLDEEEHVDIEKK